MTQAITDQRKAAQALERYLVAAAQTGDRAALARLAELSAPRLLRHANRLMGDPEAARDIVQSAWVDILRGLPNLRETAAFRAFALQIVTRKVAGTIKLRQRDRDVASTYAQEVETTSKPLGDIAADATTVRRAIAALPHTQRTTLALFYLDDLTVAEVAAVLHVPTGTIKTRLMHARAKLRAQLEGDHNDETR